jgi:predicted DNA-binding transcriptional regulator YafY
MKIDRLIGIITIIQMNKKVTAPYLAEKFEVSRRTINRDIEDICKAGIPLVTTQGAGGGISIMEGFNLDTTVFTSEELQSIFIGLKSLDSISETSHAGRLADKLSSNKDSVIALAESIVIDLSSYYKDSLAPKIASIRKAIEGKRLITFRYYYSKGEQEKTIEPYLIVFKWTAWYVFGYCPDRCNFRMYKLNRLWDLQVSDISFTLREIPSESLDFDRRLPDTYMITAVFEESEKYRLIEEYGRRSFSETEDGHLLFRRGFTYKDAAVSWSLGFGDKVEVTEPAEIRDEIKRISKSLFEKYK